MGKHREQHVHLHGSANDQLLGECIDEHVRMHCLISNRRSGRIFGRHRLHAHRRDRTLLPRHRRRRRERRLHVHARELHRGTDGGREMRTVDDTDRAVVSFRANRRGRLPLIGSADKMKKPT